MTAILNVNPVPAAGTYVSPLWQLREPAGSQPVIEAQANFVFGSGAATTLNAYLQTSFDGGVNWCDVVSFTQFTTSSARVGARLIQGAGAPVALTDGTLAAGSANALFGPWWRVKYVVVGTYGGGTTLRVDAFANVGIVPAGANAFN